MNPFLELEQARLQGEVGPLLEIPRLTLQRGGRLFITGDNGSGKSLLLQVLAGLKSLSSGTRKAGFKTFALILEEPDTQFLFSTVRRELLFPLENRRLEEPFRRRLLAETVRRFRLEPLLERNPLQLSGGQKQLLLFAVAALPTLVEYLLPLARRGGRVVAYKGSAAHEEALAAERGIRVLGGHLRQLIPVEVPGLAETRVLVVIDKVSQTPAGYPRGQGLPRKHPLGSRVGVTM